jgi:hypothetical protein
MDIKIQSSNFGGITILVTEGGGTIQEYFTETEHESKDVLADQMLSVSQDLAYRRKECSGYDEWLKLLAAYLDSNDLETLTEIISAD